MCCFFVVLTAARVARIANPKSGRRRCPKRPRLRPRHRPEVLSLGLMATTENPHGYEGLRCSPCAKGPGQFYFSYRWPE
jgi:hypothetical protein